MSGPEPSSQKKRRSSLRPVFIAGALLTSVVFLVETIIMRYLQGLIFAGQIGASTPDFQLWNLVQGAIAFAFNPVLAFAIFYQIGSKLDVDPVGRYLGLLENAFLGCLLGTVASYALTTILLQGSFGPQTNWLEYSITLVLNLVGGSVRLAFLAFAGAAIGNLRSSAPRETRTGDAVDLEQVKN